MTSGSDRLPFITTAIHKYFCLTQNLQLNERCAEFDLNLIDCYESYGYKNRKCQDYLDDLRECLYGRKRELRIQAMIEERHQQYKEGTREKLYAPPPADDAY